MLLDKHTAENTYHLTSAMIKAAFVANDITTRAVVIFIPGSCISWKLAWCFSPMGSWTMWTIQRRFYFCVGKLPLKGSKSSFFLLLIHACNGNLALIITYTIRWIIYLNKSWLHIWVHLRNRCNRIFDDAINRWWMNEFN